MSISIDSLIYNNDMGMNMSKQEILEMYRNFSAKFSNKLLYNLVDSEGNGNIAISPSRLQNVLVLLANWS